MKSLFSLLLTLFFSVSALAQTQARDAWARSTVATQKASAAFLSLRSPDAARLVAAHSPVAGRVEVHEMKMAEGVMQMRPVAALPLPAGEAVALTPGGYHLMLLDLKQALKAGDSLPLELRIERAGKPTEILKLTLPVRALGAAMH